MMHRPFLSRLPFRLHACALALVLGMSAAIAAEPDATEQTTMLTRLQDLTSHASELAFRAMNLVGVRYKYGGTAPENGLDCSGLVRYLFKEVWGTELPRTSEEISRVGERIDTKELQPGDLVFYNTLRRGFSHVGVYLGDNKFIHAPSRGGEVRVESMDLSYWKNRFNGARRINNPQQ
ncbi:peptidoglycan endopeptidase [Herbaspirillum sp. HC18]|nr:peptidoglycan endopeptidase [Herbaspirillum sp. HC18]